MIKVFRFFNNQRQKEKKLGLVPKIIIRYVSGTFENDFKKSPGVKMEIP